MRLPLNKYMAIFFLSLTIAAVLYHYIYINQPVIETTMDARLVLVKESLLKLQRVQGFEQLSIEEKLEKTYQVLEKLPPEYKGLKRQYQIALSTLPSIIFYGRVIDQHGQPVKNATVWYEGTSTYLSAGGGRGLAATDDDGYFEVDTAGAELSLGSIKHPEIDDIAYQAPKTNSSHPNKYGAIRLLSQEDKQGIYSTWRDHTEKDRAYIIHAWRLGEYEGALEGGGSFGLYSGKTYTINLSHTDKYKRISEGLNDGDLHIICTRSHIESYRDIGNWSVSIVPVNGGILETDDLYMNMAPVSGYQATLEINMRKGSQNYQKSLLNKRYYITLKNGQKYGSLFINIDPFVSIEDDACSIRINSKINPTGSRNLELKRSSISQQQLPSPQKLASNS